MAREIWRSAITNATDKTTLIRGYPLEELINATSFAEVFYLLLKGEFPSKDHAVIMNAILVACADHGVAVPSAQAARRVISGGSPLQAGVAAGVLALGESHGGAIEECARRLQEAVKQNLTPSVLVDAAVAKNERLPGFGHKVYEVDPRTQELLVLAKKHKLVGIYVEFAVAVEKALEKAKGKKLCLNIDGITAALLLEMGFDWHAGKGFFILGRTAGLIAQCAEEKIREKPFRRLADEDVQYDGVDERHL